MIFKRSDENSNDVKFYYVFTTLNVKDKVIYIFQDVTQFAFSLATSVVFFKLYNCGIGVAHFILFISLVMLIVSIIRFFIVVCVFIIKARKAGKRAIAIKEALNESRMMQAYRFPKLKIR